MKERRAVASEMAARYKQTRKKGKREILNQLMELTGYTRRYAARLLRQLGKKTRVGKITPTDNKEKMCRRKSTLLWRYRNYFDLPIPVFVIRGKWRRVLFHFYL